jgi:DNA (cytosine-5)-methyltransferase 1
MDGPMPAQTATAANAVAAPPLIVPTGGTWREDATSALVPMPTRTTRENDGIAFPFHPYLVPIRSGRNRSSSARDPLATIVADGGNHGLCVPPFLTVHRGGEGDVRTQGMTDPLASVTAGGNHFGFAVPPEAQTAFVTRNNGSRGDGGEHNTPATDPLRTLTVTGHQSLVQWGQALGHMLVPYYGNGTAQPATEPIGTIPTVDRWSLASLDIDVEDVLFRMLEPGEIGAAMAFRADYQLAGTSKRVRVRQYGNAVTPPVSEVLYSALVEAIIGDDLERWSPELLAA